MASSTATDVMRDEFLLVRARCLEIAATLDRIDHADGGRESLAAECGDLRSKIDEAIAILSSSSPDRAAKLQHLFSRPYDPNWRAQLGVK